MQIYNQTTKTVISSHAKIAQSLSDQLLGLINSKNPRTMIFYTRFGIHTFGLKTPIGVLVVNSEDKVVQKAIVKPFRIFIWNPKYSVIVELPVSQFDEITVGDRLVFKTEATKK